MISNINYKGFMEGDMSELVFSEKRPQQCVRKFDEYTIIFFRSRKCRIMGCKKELDITTLPFNITIERIQSITVTTSIGHQVNLFNLSQIIQSVYEPELFPALRLTQFKPLCVNVFMSGKIVITGIKTLEFQSLVDYILNLLFFYV